VTGFAVPGAAGSRRLDQPEPAGLAAESGGGLAVYGAAAVPGAAAARAELVAAGVPGLLVAKDPTLWGDQAEADAKIRLGWVDTFTRSRALLPEIRRVRDAVRAAGLDHVVLAGMGGSSLAPEVICATLGRPLTVLDTTDPGQVRRALADRLDRTVVVVASKSGSTVETDSHRRMYWQAFTDAGLDRVGARFVMVTDPGSPLAGTAQQMGAHLVLADPEVGGRYSALTAFGLVPAMLAGVDVTELLDQAEQAHRTLAGPTGNPALALGAALGAAALAGRDKVALVDDGTGITGLGDWAEQLIAESTGKDARGILPVVIETPTSPGATGPAVLTVTVGGSLVTGAVPGSGVQPDVAVNGPLGAQFLVWEVAVALAGRILQINPFDQPNVTESKDNTRQILAAGLPTGRPAFVDGAIEGYGPADLSATNLPDALRWLLDQVEPTGYVAIMAYLDRFGDAAAAGLRPELARVLAGSDEAGTAGVPVTFGWGPRFLHSTGQYHKGGPAVGGYLQITGAVSDDLDVPGQPYSFGTLQAAQAAGDRQALLGRRRPLLHLHLTDRVAGLAQLLAVAGEMPA
jgi:glucose-6-phosphate isomerase